jgi:peptidyl-prolyl cis-trans isomerase D
MALEFLRRSATSVFAWVLLGLLALIFGLSFGLPSDSLTFGVQPIVSVHGDPVGDDDYQYQFNLMSRVLPIPKDAKFRELMGLREEVLDAIVERMVLSQAAEEMGLAATEWDAETLTLNGHLIVLGDTYDWLGPANFNYDFFTDAHLRSLRIAEARYLDHQRRELLARVVRDVLTSSMAVSEAEVRAEYEKNANTISLRYVRFDNVSYAQLVDPTEEEIGSYVASSESLLEQQYESQGTRFSKLPKQVRLRFIKVRKPAEGSTETNARAARKRVSKALARIRAGEDFRQVAREVSEEAVSARRGGDYGWVSIEGTGSGLDPVVDEAAKTLEDGGVSEVLEGVDSLFVVRVEGRREGDVDKAEAFRELAAEAVQAERGKALARQAAEEALLAVKEGKKLSDLFQTPGSFGQADPAIEDMQLGDGAEILKPATAEGKPTIQITGPFPRHAQVPGLGQTPDLVEAAWEADPTAELIPKVFEITTGWVLAGVENKELATDEGYTEARKELYAAMAERKANKMTARWAARRCLESKGRGEIVGNQKKIRRLMTYDTKLAVDEEGRRQLRPYAVCDRVGNRGGLLRPGIAALAGGGDAR